MESKENTDEDVKKENFFFFSSLLRSEIPSVYFSFSSPYSSSFFCRPEKVVILFFFSFPLFLNYLASYPAALLFLAILSGQVSIVDEKSY
jgi:hypothetical protein